MLGLPYIANNIITENSGRYAGGIMIAYCEGMTLENNVISYNYTTGNFGGGGGIYVDWESINIINNTIVNNHSDGTGGGLCITGNAGVIKNCIIYGNTGNGNTATNEPVIRKRFEGNPDVSYTNIEGGWDGEEIMDALPLFIDTIQFKLSVLSPSIDAGDPDPIYFDQTLEGNLNIVLLPAQGFLLNDMGAYGGPHYQVYEAPIDTPPVGFAFNASSTGPNFDLKYANGLLEIKMDKSEYICPAVRLDRAFFFCKKKNAGSSVSLEPNGFKASRLVAKKLDACN